MTFGGDFHSENALSNFKNFDKLIKYVNARRECRDVQPILQSIETISNTVELTFGANLELTNLN